MSAATIPASPFDESVYALLPKPIPRVVKPPVYRSIHAQTVKEEYKPPHMKTGFIGPPPGVVSKVVPKQFLKKGERERGKPSQKFEKDRVVRKAPVPKDKGHVVRKDKNFVKGNIGESIHAPPRKQPSPPSPVYTAKSDYGLVPKYITHTAEPVQPTVKHEAHEHSHQISSQLADLSIYEQAQPEHDTTLRQLPEEERLEIMEGLKRNHSYLMNEYQKLSLTIDTLPKIAKKLGLEAKLRELEKDMEIFGRPGVWVDFGKD
ncbi:calmodulin-binding-domain-containing protein [Gaertneriomyces semiglobifer]|nr:calmodulin-binding-domain-containing protein [Gaertneriomyces semiglobifer]